MKLIKLEIFENKQIGVALSAMILTALIVWVVLNNDSLTNPKLVVASIAGFALIGVIAGGKYSFIYWFTVFAIFSRRLNIPFVGEWEPATMIFFLLFFLMSVKALPVLLSQWILPVLFFGIVYFVGKVNGSVFGNVAEEWVLPFITLYCFLSVSHFFIHTEKDLEKLSSFIVIISGIIGITALMAYFGLADGVVILKTHLEGEGSKVFGISYTNTVHGYSPLALLFLKDKKWPGWLKLIILCGIVFGVLISEKRLAFLALLMVTLQVLRQSYLQRDYKTLTIIIGGAFIVLTYFLDRFVSRFNIINTTLETNEATIDSNRIYRLQVAWDLIVKSPFFGNGAGAAYYIHNGFLEMLANMGLIALVFFNSWLIRPLRYVFRPGLQQNWAVATVTFMLSLFAFEVGISRLDLFWMFILVYTGFLNALKIQRGNDQQPILKPNLHEQSQA